jgi:hypothetical protein
VPTAKLAFIIVAAPLVTDTGVPIAVEPSISCTCPFAPTEAFTAMVNVMFVPLATFVLATDTWVVVVTGPPPPPPLPPLHPSVKVSMQTSPSPSAARYFFLPGRKSKNIDANPVPALSVHQPAIAPRFVGVLAAHKLLVTGAAIADIELSGSDSFIVSVPVVLPEEIVTGAHDIPAGKLAVAGQFTVTAPVNPFFGVSVIMEVPEAIVPAGDGVVAIVMLPTVIVKVPAALTVKLTPFEVPPPGAALVTVTDGVPAVAMALAGMVTWICVDVTEFGAIPVSAPKFTVLAPLTKFVPFTVNANAAPPAVALVGEIVVIVGTGLAAGLIVKVTLFEVPPAAVTVTPGVPAAAMSLAGTVTMICVAAMDDGVSAGFVPNFTVAPATKFVPFMVNGNAAPPAVALVGEIVVIVGAGLLPMVPVKVKFKTLMPPKATGLGSRAPNELTMM